MDGEQVIGFKEEIMVLAFKEKTAFIFLALAIFIFLALAGGY